MKAGKATVVNLMGRVFLSTIDCPFRAMDSLLQNRAQDAPRVILVDIHAEATSEKQAMGWYLDGRVSAVVGTHTHVATADARILPKGTAYVTDVGMVGPLYSIIGSDPGAVLERFLYQVPQRFTIPGGPVLFNSILVDIDEDTGHARSIQRIDRVVE
jgi:metallophosphoesterase (TIGR00282 family)